MISLREFNPAMPSKRKIDSQKIEKVESRIYLIRGHRVMIDSDLAAIYGVTTKRLNEQLKRNRSRFPEGFAFQLTVKELRSLRSQFVTSSSTVLRSQIATSKGRGGRRYLPWAFTEHGAIMLASATGEFSSVIVPLLPNPMVATLLVYTTRRTPDSFAASRMLRVP